MKWKYGLSILLIIPLLTVTHQEEVSKKRAGKILVGVQSTRTYVSLTTLTSTFQFICWEDLPSTNCKRRRRKRSLDAAKFMNTDESAYAATAMEPSTYLKDNDDQLSENKRAGRLRATFWSTATSYLTIYTTTTDSAVSFSVSFYCSVAGLNFPPSCGG